MQSLSFKPVLIKTLAFATLFLSVFALSAKAGVDSYEIYLNNKLLFRHFLDKPLDLYTMNLTEANAGDNIYIRYSQCNAPSKIGKGRSITLKDQKGNIVKQWKFKDSESSSMMIPVKELLEVQKNAAEGLVLFYSADGLSRGQRLAILQSDKKKNA